MPSLSESTRLNPGKLSGICDETVGLDRPAGRWTCGGGERSYSGTCCGFACHVIDTMCSVWYSAGTLGSSVCVTASKKLETCKLSRM